MRWRYLKKKKAIQQFYPINSTHFYKKKNNCQEYERISTILIVLSHTINLNRLLFKSTNPPPIYDSNPNYLQHTRIILYNPLAPCHKSKNIYFRRILREKYKKLFWDKKKTKQFPEQMGSYSQLSFINQIFFICNVAAVTSKHRL